MEPKPVRKWCQQRSIFQFTELSPVICVLPAAMRTVLTSPIFATIAPPPLPFVPRIISGSGQSSRAWVRLEPVRHPRIHRRHARDRQPPQEIADPTELPTLDSKVPRSLELE